MTKEQDIVKLMKEQDKINKLAPKGGGALGGLVDNANNNIQEVFGTNVFNDKKRKNNGGLI
ncbi:hypothetical protein LCGC14_1626430 [marine sediment metagenome]|uniref:Uncharacterized protein n=1 Tax=marine sediment metagenome TaxID=412755 RepID=A0A0F9KJI7_9ZZZZ